MVMSPPASAGDTRDAGLIPGSGRSPGEGNSNPLQYSCLENSMDRRRAWWATVHGITKSWAWLSTHTHALYISVISSREFCFYLSQQLKFVFLKKQSDTSVKINTLALECSVQFSSLAQLCPTLCNPMNCSMPGLPVRHQLPEFTQTHAHQVGDAIQPSHPLSSLSPPAPNPSQHQSLFQWVNSSHEVAKVLEFQLQHQSFQWTPRTDLL